MPERRQARSPSRRRGVARRRRRRQGRPRAGRRLRRGGDRRGARRRSRDGAGLTRRCVPECGSGSTSGKARVGVAACDRDGLLATPVATLARGGRPTARVVALVDGARRDRDRGRAAAVAQRRRHRIHDRCARVRRAAAAGRRTPVRLVDERLSTVSAQRALHAAGRRQGLASSDRPSRRCYHPAERPRPRALGGPPAWRRRRLPDPEGLRVAERTQLG